TLVGQKTSTSPYGRQAEHCGSPIRMSEMLSTIPGAYFVSRVSVSTPANLAKAKRTIKKAFQNQMEGKGLNIVEVLSTCPTNWGRAPYESMRWVDENMQPYYPLGDYKQAEEAK
ncbi:MAG TPA: 2-oxoglutarate oxidoreductase, partial [Bacillota bacterium]|nr:2-oxoglutarate oxidoreductase [Bacillota bacterium]